MFLLYEVASITIAAIMAQESSTVSYALRSYSAMMSSLANATYINEGNLRIRDVPFRAGVITDWYPWEESLQCLQVRSRNSLQKVLQ